MKARSLRVLILLWSSQALALSSSLATAPAKGNTFVELGGRQWLLRIESRDATLIAGLKRLPTLSWCFEAVQGRGLLKNMNTHLSWDDSIPALSLGKSEKTPDHEDAAILGCLDATLKENPPAHALPTDEVNFQYTVKRRR